jgi:hypothetical protein
MRSRSWFLATLALIIVVAAVTVAVNASLDIYGVFHDAHGRRLPAFGNQRIAKYLLSKKYVPSNFDAILIGSSMSANWNTGRIRALRVYNESMSAANIVEEKSLVDHALSRPGIKLALLVVHPYLTNSHRFATVQLSERETVGALGSLTLWDAYKEVFRYGQPSSSPQSSDEFGTEDFVASKKLNPLLQRMMEPHKDFEIDPIAMTAYQDLVGALRRQNVQIVFIVPPLAEELLLSKQDEFHKYAAHMRALVRDQDKVIDFTGDSYAAFRKNPRNFSDGIHLERGATEEITSTMDALLSSWIASGELHLEPARLTAQVHRE